MSRYARDKQKETGDETRGGGAIEKGAGKNQASQWVRTRLKSPRLATKHHSEEGAVGIRTGVFWREHKSQSCPLANNRCCLATPCRAILRPQCVQPQVQDAGGPQEAHRRPKVNREID